MGGLLLAAEGLCRLLPSPQPVEVANELSRWDADWDGEFWTLAKGRDVNRHGLRDRNHSLKRRPGQWRIAALGDSVTMGHLVSRRDTWSDHLGRRLSRQHDRIDMFNVAMLGWSARQERIAYERFVRPYRVDDVLLGVCLNDIPEMQNNLAPGRIPAALMWLNRHSALVRIVVNARTREIGKVEELFERDGAPNVENAWELYFAEVLELRRAVEADGASFSMIVFPFRFQLQEDAPEPVAQQRLAEFCERHDIPLLDLLAPFREFGEGAFLDHNHLSRDGAKEAAKRIEEWNLLRPPAPGSEAPRASDGPSPASP